MDIKTSEIVKVNQLFKKFILPNENSHKGQNGKVLIIGGSSLFHSASLWAAEVASHFADMVHYSSTIENEKIFHELKKNFRNGIVVQKNDLDSYVKEDDVVLIGPGMMRDGYEGKYTREITRRLFKEFPEKKYVIDAGSLQMMDKSWLTNLKVPAIITPHQQEFERLFGLSLLDKNQKEKEEVVKETAKRYKVVVLLKAIVDIISNGDLTYVVAGGNAGLTKGGTGDMLAGLVASFYAKNDSLNSSVLASVLLKKTAESLFEEKGYWYNNSDIIKRLPNELSKIVL